MPVLTAQATPLYSSTLFSRAIGFTALEAPPATNPEGTVPTAHANALELI